MFVAVLLLPFLPLAVARSGGVDSPLLFNATMRMGIVLGCLVALAAGYRSLLVNAGVCSIIARSAVRWTMFFSLLSYFDLAFLAASAQFVDISVSAVLYELWPILMIILMARLFRLGQYRRNFRAMAPSLVVVFAGVGFVVASQTGGLALGDAGFSTLAVGLGLAVAAALASSFSAFTFRWARDLVDRLRAVPVAGLGGAPVAGYTPGSLAIFGVIVGYMLSSLASGVVTLGLGVAWGEAMSLDLVVVAGGGGLLIAAGGVLFRIANTLTDNLGVNALGYVTPAASLVWLAFFLGIGVARVDFLIVGTAAIVAANLMVNLVSGRLAAWLGLGPGSVGGWGVGLLLGGVVVA